MGVVSPVDIKTHPLRGPFGVFIGETQRDQAIGFGAIRPLPLGLRVPLLDHHPGVPLLDGHHHIQLSPRDRLELEGGVGVGGDLLQVALLGAGLNACGEAVGGGEEREEEEEGEGEGRGHGRGGEGRVKRGGKVGVGWER